MASLANISYLELNADRISDPVLIVGSRMYEYDHHDLRQQLAALGVEEITGIDIDDGPGVDAVVDICAAQQFVDAHRGRFATVLCLEMINYVTQPFAMGQNLTDLLRPGGSLLVSAGQVHKLTQMPEDYWRVTASGLELVFPGLAFDRDRARLSLMRSRTGELLPYSKTLPEVLKQSRSPDETTIGFLLRRVHRRFFARGIFELSRLMAEVSVHTVAVKPLAA